MNGGALRRAARQREGLKGQVGGGRGFGRRRFLGALPTMVVVPFLTPPRAEAAAASEGAARHEPAYRDTEHIREFYRQSRF